MCNYDLFRTTGSSSIWPYATDTSLEATLGRQEEFAEVVVVHGLVPLQFAQKFSLAILRGHAADRGSAVPRFLLQTRDIQDETLRPCI